MNHSVVLTLNGSFPSELPVDARWTIIMEQPREFALRTSAAIMDHPMDFSLFDIPMGDSRSNGSTPGYASTKTGSIKEGDEMQLSTTKGDGNKTPTRQVTGFRWVLVCMAIFSGNILYGLDTTIAADIQASVSETFNNVTQLGWLGVGFTLGSTVTILPLGKAYARFDNKWVFISCLTMFSAGSALCGAASSMNAMIIGRVWAGAGGAGVYLG